MQEKKKENIKLIKYYIVVCVPYCLHLAERL